MSKISHHLELLEHAGGVAEEVGDFATQLLQLGGGEVMGVPATTGQLQRKSAGWETVSGCQLRFTEGERRHIITGNRRPNFGHHKVWFGL